MTSHLSWERVINNDMDRLEFGACHVNLAWRRHSSSKAKFLGLRSAFVDSPHRLPILLQEVGANVNARNYPAQRIEQCKRSEHATGRRREDRSLGQDTQLLGTRQPFPEGHALNAR